MGVYKGIAQDNVTITSGNAALTTLTVSGIAMFNGAFELTPPVTKTADFTLADNESVIITNKAGSSCVVTLPAASSWTGRVVLFKTLQAQHIVSASANVCPNNSATPGTAMTANASAGSWVLIVSDGTNWVVMAHH